MSKEEALISLEQAKELVAQLEQGNVSAANNMLRQVTQNLNQPLFDEVGKLTRHLHSALQDFNIDHRLAELANREIPDATERLNYVIEMTEQAANRTMDAVEAGLPMMDGLQQRLKTLQPDWQLLMQKELPLEDFKALCHDMDALIIAADSDMVRLKELFNEVLMAQDFQDLTGQVIRRVITLVREVELSLVELLTVFGENQKEQEQPCPVEAVGPAATVMEQQEAVNSQDEVDDLLSSLGF